MHRQGHEMVEPEQTGELEIDPETIRRTQRELKPSALSLQYRTDMAKHKEKEFEKAYDVYKKELVSARQAVRTECREGTLYSLIDDIQSKYESVLKT